MRRTRVVIALGVAVAVVAAGLGGWLWLGGEHPRPAGLRAENTSALYRLVDSRRADAAPLTTAEVFTAGTVSLGGMTRDAVEEFGDCGEALWGVEAPGCTQALRATYRGEAIAGQFVIFNVPDGRSADALVAELRGEGFVRQAVPFDAARSRAEVRALGHYVTVSWVGALDGAPATDLVEPLIALDGLGGVVRSRVLSAT